MNRRRRTSRKPSSRRGRPNADTTATSDPTLGALKLDVVFTVLHGPYGEDGTVQGLLEMAGLAYVGNGVLASAAGMDKAIMKRLFKSRGLPVCHWHDFVRSEWDQNRSALLQRIGTLGLPVFVKPANLGSSVGISKVKTQEELVPAIELALQFDRKVVVEAAVPRAREIECAVLGNDDPKTSVPGEVLPSREFYDYEAKYLDEGSRTVIPADLPPSTAAEVQRLAVEAFRAIDGAGLARVDFLMDGETGTIYLNEINTLPGFTNISMYSKMWEASGVAVQRACGPPHPIRDRAASGKAALENQRAVSAGLPSAECGVMRIVLVSALCTLNSALASAQPGITAAPQIARAYDLILDADFDQLNSTLPAVCPPAPIVACQGLEALGLWWRIQLDPDNRSLDAAFLSAANTAIAEAERFAAAEPSRAEAWFFVGAAYGVRAQFRVYRAERFAAARDGKQIKEALERALALDPGMHDAEFGIGMYRYYAGVAPTFFRFLRFLLLLPGGDREGGLAQLERASQLGLLVRGEAQFQIHVLYLWYEHKSKEALDIIRGLQQRYPHNPLFHQIEAEILDIYFHDHAGSLKASERLLALAASRSVFHADIAEKVARRNIAKQSIALKAPKPKVD